MPINQHFAFCRKIITGNKVNCRTFANARFADKSNAFSPLNLEIQTIKHGCCSIVGERNIFELHRSLNLRWSKSVFGMIIFLFCRKYFFFRLFNAYEAVLKRLPIITQHHKWSKEQSGVSVKSNQFANTQFSQLNEINGKKKYYPLRYQNNHSLIEIYTAPKKLKFVPKFCRIAQKTFFNFLFLVFFGGHMFNRLDIRDGLKRVSVGVCPRGVSFFKKICRRRNKFYQNQNINNYA